MYEKMCFDPKYLIGIMKVLVLNSDTKSVTFYGRNRSQGL